MSKGAVIAGTDLKGLAEQIRLKTTALIKELEAKEDEGLPIAPAGGGCRGCGC
jgi:hypothetical protein